MKILCTSGEGAGLELGEEIGAGAPHPPKCLAKWVLGGHNAAWCLANEGHYCPFSRHFGSDLLCEHPDRERIVERTLRRAKRRKRTFMGQARARPPCPRPD
jgi:hypothetical protein